MQSLLAWATVGSLAKAEPQNSASAFQLSTPHQQTAQADPEALSSKLKKDQLTLLKDQMLHSCCGRVDFLA